MKIIETQKFILRPFQRGDEESLAQNINNEKIYKATMHIPFPYTLKDAEEWIEKKIREQENGNREGVSFAVEIQKEVVGAVSLFSLESHKAEIGYWLAEKLWNQGIMTGAVAKMTDFGFQELKLKRIYAKVFPFNKASMRVLEKNGYELEGIMKNNSLKDGVLRDDYLFAKSTGN
ncbi:MAG: GNAT family N-acetyltransferase [Candidatus Nealsonbacteria bacterium]|nr:GNAT family N-acetyltransferase [Candidatus Nealsonbacteria bacterium]